MTRKFKAGDLVKVTSSAKQWHMWVDTLNDFVGDGKTYTVFRDEDHIGDVLVKFPGDSWWIPKSCLTLVNKSDSLGKPDAIQTMVDNIETTYTYKGAQFSDVAHLRRELVREVYVKYRSSFKDADSLDALINGLNVVNEVCQKLK